MVEEIKALSVRFAIGTYEALKECAENQRQSLNDVVNEAVENYLKGSAAPAPKAKPQKKSSSTVPEIPDALAELPERVGKLEEKDTEIEGSMRGLAMRMDKLQGMVSTLLSAYGSYVPPTQPTPWQPFAARSAAGRKKKMAGADRDLEEKVERARELLQEVGTHPVVVMRGVEGLEEHLKTLTDIQMLPEDKEELLAKAEEMKELYREFGRLAQVREKAREELEKREKGMEKEKSAKKKSKSKATKRKKKG